MDTGSRSASSVRPRNRKTGTTHSYDVARDFKRPALTIQCGRVSGVKPGNCRVRLEGCRRHEEEEKGNER